MRGLRPRGAGVLKHESENTNHMSGDLEKLRQRIDEIDETLQSLISDRVRLAKQIGEIKRQAGSDSVYRARGADFARHRGAQRRAADGRAAGDSAS